MKKKILCIFSLIFYLLIVCTVLSQKIESVMAVQTESHLREMNEYSSSVITIGLRAVFADEQGDHLYEVIEGTGWESGLRIQEIPGHLWSVDSRGVINLQSGRDYNVVYSATRQPATGDQAAIIENWEEVNDKYLVLFPESMPVAEEMQLPENVEIAGQSNNTLLLDMKNTTLPFLEHKAKSMSDAMSMQGCRIFSLTEAVQFLEEIPSVMMIIPVLGMSLLLWAFSCYLSIHADKNKVFIFFNAGMMAVLLCLLPYILSGINLPASMLPGENIFDWQHYKDEYSLIFSALEAFPEEANSLAAVKELMMSRCKDTLCYGLSASVGIIFIEFIMIKIKKRL